MVNVGEVLTNVEAGEIVAMVGAGLLTVRVWAPDVPPPGAGLTTVIESVPPTAMSEAGTVTLMDVLEAKVVVNGTPLKYMVDEALKFVPMTVRMKDDPPAVTEAGLIDEVVGTGLLTVRVWALDVPPPGVGFTTVMEAVPPFAISAAVIVAVTCV